MKLSKILATSLLTVFVALPSAFADGRPGDRGPQGPGFGRPGDPGRPGDNRGGDGRGDGHGPDFRDPRCLRDPRDCGGDRGWGPRGPGFPIPPPPPPPPPPSFGGFCQGNFNGSFADGRQVMISVNGTGQFVTASVVIVNPQASLVAQGVCTSVNGASQLTLTLNNGVVESGQVYQASDGKFYFDGTESGSNQRFILQRQ